MFCKQCGEEINENQAICLKCGAKAGDGKNYCQNCGKAVNENASVCMNCGVAIKKSNDTHNNMTLALIALFIGGLGIHNFMMGETKKGVLKILLCWTGISSIIALIDAIKLFGGNYEINTEKFF